MTGEAPPVALSRLVGRNRRRYGGYIVHVGIAVLLLGVAGSSSFNEQKDVRLEPGETVKIKDYEVTYREPTVAIEDDRSGTGAPLSFGAVLDVKKDDERFTMHPARNYYPSQNSAMGPVGRYFGGEATSEVDLRWGLKQDLWLAVQPDLRKLKGPIRRANDLPEQFHGEAIVAVARALRGEPAAGRVPRDRVPARRVDLARRRDRDGGRADRAVAVAGGPAPAGHEPVRGAPRARALARVVEVVLPAIALAALVALLVLQPLRSRSRRGRAGPPRRPRGGEGEQVQGDQGRRARLPDGQAVRGGLARARRRAARAGDRDPARSSTSWTPR